MFTLQLISAALFFALSGDAEPAPHVIVVVGAPGTPEFGQQFHEWADHWLAAAKKAGSEVEIIGNEEDADQNDRKRLQDSLAKLAEEGDTPVWLVLIGHGTFDGRSAKFNLRGPDITPDDLAAWLAPIQRPLAVVNCASASAPFLNRLAGRNRVVITSTRSGNEQNFARFGQYMAEAIDDDQLAADLDKDGQVSLLEAYLTACRQLTEFYDSDARLATEHALLDDNGDGLGTPAAWFRGLRATKRAKEGAALDGTRANQFLLVRSDRERHMSPESRKRRDELEVDIAALRLQKDSLSEDVYFSRLEPLMFELGQLYEGSKEPAASSPGVGETPPTAAKK